MLEIIVNACKNCGLRLSDVEKEAGLSNGAIRKWSHSKPSFDSAVRVARILKIPLKKLADCVPREDEEIKTKKEGE